VVTRPICQRLLARFRYGGKETQISFAFFKPSTTLASVKGARSLRRNGAARGGRVWPKGGAAFIGRGC